MTATPNNEAVGVDWPPGVLSRKRTLEILREHNAWRRGAPGPQADARLLGLALDAAIATLTPSPAPGGRDAVAVVCLVTDKQYPHFAEAQIQLYGGYEPAIGDKFYTAPPASVPVSALLELAEKMQEESDEYPASHVIQTGCNAYERCIELVTALAQEHDNEEG